jgi:hypothetical protein
MAALLGLDASLRPIGRPQKLVEMENAPVLLSVQTTELVDSSLDHLKNE